MHPTKLDWLPDSALSLLASCWPGLDAHASRDKLLLQLQRQLQQTELSPVLSPALLPQHLPVALFGFSVASYQDSIYVYGGRASCDTASSGIRSHVYCFDVQQRKWHTCKQYNHPPPRRWHTAVVYGDCMHIYGGQAWDEAQGEWEATNIISRYNFTTHTWSEAAQAGCGPSVKLKRAGAGVGSRLFVLPAGQAGAPSFNMLHCFDLESGCWSMRVCLGPDTPDGQQLLLEQLLHYDGALLAVFSCNPAAAAASTHPDHQQQQTAPGHSQAAAAAGGSNAMVASQQHLTVYSLSLTDCRWHKLAARGEAPVSRTQSCIALVDDLLLVSGGARPGAAGAEQALLPDSAFLHLPSKQWHQLQLPQHCQPARACHAAAVMPEGGSICLIGGWHEAWPQPAQSVVLVRGYIRKQQHLGPDTGAIVAVLSSRPVFNTELRLALLKAASSSPTRNPSNSTSNSTDLSSRNGHTTTPTTSTPSGASSTGFHRSLPYCDVVITSADGDQFGAHRFLLASQSRVFEAMLRSGGMAEASSGTVVLPDVSSAVLEALLSYLYGGLPSGIPQGLVLELFTAADRFLLPGLAAECVLLLLGCLTAENVSLVADLANTHRLQELWQACVAFAAAPQQQLEVFNSAAFARLWKDSAGVAQAFTTQVVGLTQQVVDRMKQQLPGAVIAPKDLAGCVLPPVQQGGAILGLAGKRQRTE